MVSHLQRFCMLVATGFAQCIRCGLGGVQDGHAENTTPIGSTSPRKRAEEAAVSDYTFDTGPNEDGFEPNPSVASLEARGLIMPVGSWKEKWDLTILFLIFYSAVTVPLRVCFAAPAQGFMWLLEVSMTLVFIYDVYLNFRTVYFDSRAGMWVTGRPQLAQRYLTSWFWIDAPSSVPVELISVVFDAHNLSILRILRMVRLFRLVKLLKIEEYIETLENHFDVNLRVLRIVFMVIKMCFLGHVMGCLWFGMSLFSKAEAELEASDDTWRTTYDDGRVEVANATTSLKYMVSLYWAVTTMTTVGYGDLIPANDVETAYALTAMLLSSLIFGYMISNVGVLVASMDRQAAIVEEKLDSAKEYIAFRGLPKDLAMRVKKHFSYFYSANAGFDEVELLEGLSPSLRSEVTRFVLKETLGKIPLFARTLDPDFQLEVFPHIVPVSYSQGEVVFRKGEASRDLMFLLSGEISILSPSVEGQVTAVLQSSPPREVMLSPNGESLIELEHAGCFGESVLLGLRRPATYIAATWVETLTLAKTDLSDLLCKNKRVGVKIASTLLSSAGRRQRLNGLMAKFVINTLPKSSEVRAAMIVQRMWQKAMMRLSADTAPITAILVPELTPRQQSQLRVLEHTRDKALELIDDMRRELLAGTLDLSAPWKPNLRHAESIVVDALIGQGKAESLSRARQNEARLRV